MLQLNLKTKNKPELGTLIPRKKMCELVVGSVVSVVALLWWIVVWLALAEAVLIVESFMIDFFEVIE